MTTDDIYQAIRAMLPTYPTLFWTVYDKIGTKHFSHDPDGTQYECLRTGKGCPTIDLTIIKCYRDIGESIQFIVEHLTPTMLQQEFSVCGISPLLNIMARRLLETTEDPH